MPDTIIKTQIRWLIRRDMPKVLEIEKACFQYTWTEEDFIFCLRQRDYIGMVAEHDHTIVGFIIYQLQKTKLRIINFAVHPDYQRQGVGAVMIDKLKFNIDNSERRNEIVIDIRESNLPVQKFFRSQGFLWIQTLPDCYDHTDEDAYVMSFYVHAEATHAK